MCGGGFARFDLVFGRGFGKGFADFGFDGGLAVAGGEKMKMVRLALAFALWSMGGFAALAQDAAWLQLEAQPSAASAAARAEAYAAEFPEVRAVKSGPGWHAIVLGPFLPEEAAGLLATYRREGRVPSDAFISDGKAFGDVIWPEGAVSAEAGVVAPAPADTAAVEPAVQAVVEPPADAPIVVPEETPKEARASEAALTKEERMALQDGLKWYGFYDAKIDGSFGKGTRNSMAAWQTANGYEPTGILTSLQRATLTANHAADLAEFGFETITEPEAGIEITLPLSLVQFDRYEPPFVHFAEKNGSGLRVMLISEPGGTEALAGLYAILQTLEVMPESGERALDKKSFTLQGASSKVESLAYAETADGMVKGYLVVWNPADADRMARILLALRASFRAVGDKALDPGLVPMEDAARAGMLSGLETRRAERSASGLFVDAKGSVVTALSNVAECGRVTLGAETVAEVVAQDEASGLALLAPKAPLAPTAFAALSTASPRPGSEVSVAGYSYGERQPGATLTFGSFDAAEGMGGEAGFARIIAPVMAGDVGGPVLDNTGAVVGVLLPTPTTGKVPPPGMALAADAASLGALMQGAGLTAATSTATAAATPDALNAGALGMTVLVSCWAE